MLAPIDLPMQRRIALRGRRAAATHCGNAPQRPRGPLTIGDVEHNLGSTEGQYRQGPGVHARAST